MELQLLNLRHFNIYQKKAISFLGASYVFINMSLYLIIPLYGCIISRRC